MITVEEAIKIISETVRDFGTEEVELGKAIGRILREPLQADRPFPPYHRITMDGIAIHYEAFAKGQRTFPVEGVAAAGTPQQQLQDPAACLEVMTGSMLPEGADTVIRYEDVSISEGKATINIEEVSQGQNIHRQGIDRQKGDEVVPPGTMISPAEVGVASTIGKARLLVSRLPRTMIISTGDELVEINRTPKPHQIRRSNVYRLRATLAELGIPADTHHMKDDYDEITEKLRQIAAEYEVIILSGGVSKGKFDYLPGVLEELGVKKLFHRIRQRPGKPFWFGESPKGRLIFALPGNPVSSFLCTHRYFIPWLRTCLGYPDRSRPHAILKEDFTFTPDLTYFLQVRVDYDEQGRIWATPEEGNGSGDLANLVDADAFLQLPRGRNKFNAGEVFPLFFYR
jgi:molybdopterin molybdotransferase